MVYVLLSIMLLGWLGGVLLFSLPLTQRRRGTLPPATPEPDSGGAGTGGARGVSVIVPARNEANRIGELLRALAAQTVSPLEIIVMDDESTDDTAAVAERLGARVVHTPPRPERWMGKPWACQCGADEAAGDTLLFLDADVSLAPDAFAKLLAARKRSMAVVSVQPHHRVQRPYETLSALFNAQVVASVGLGPTTRGLYGPCIMMTVDEYRRCGGHAAVRASVVDDVALGRACRDAHLRLCTYLGGRTIHFRMYPEGFRQMLSGWVKNFLHGAAATARPMLFAQSMWIVGAATVAVQAAFAVARLPIGIVPLSVALGAYAAYAALLALSLPRYGQFGPGTALLFPVHIIFFVCVTACALWVRVRRGSVNWRGRQVTPHGDPVSARAADGSRSDEA